MEISSKDRDRDHPMDGIYRFALARATLLWGCRIFSELPQRSQNTLVENDMKEEATEKERADTSEQKEWRYASFWRYREFRN